MTRKLILTLTAIALAALALSACGGSSNPMAETEPESPLTEETNPDPSEALPNKGKGGEIDIKADPDGNLDYETGDLDVKAGTVQVNFNNPASLGHDVIIERDDGSVIGGTEVISEQQTALDVELDPGDYIYYCSVANHQSEGMQGNLKVK